MIAQVELGVELLDAQDVLRYVAIDEAIFRRLEMVSGDYDGVPGDELQEAGEILQELFGLDSLEDCCFSLQRGRQDYYGDYGLCLWEY